MSYIDQIAYNLGRRDEVPNQELARRFAQDSNQAGIEEMAEHLFDKNKSIASDCLKVMYETGYIKPELIAPYSDDFIRLLSSKNNRMVWGAMIAIATIAEIVPEKIFAKKELIFEKIEAGTVITHVWGVKTLINLAKVSDEYYKALKHKLFSLQAECRPVDFAKRAEDMLPAIRTEDISEYIDILNTGKERLSSAGEKRVNAVIRKLLKNQNK